MNGRCSETAAAGYARALAQITTRPWTLMEVCGGHTHSIVKFGVDELLPNGVTLVHGPGCPMCVTPLELLEKAIEIASRPGEAVLVSGVSGDLERHDMAIMAVRENLSFESAIGSDCAPLVEPVMSLLNDGLDVH